VQPDRRTPGRPEERPGPTRTERQLRKTGECDAAIGTDEGRPRLLPEDERNSPAPGRRRPEERPDPTRPERQLREAGGRDAAVGADEGRPRLLSQEPRDPPTPGRRRPEEHPGPT